MKRLMQRILSPLLPGQRVTRPVFVIGCGRSGTTILGRCLGTHENVTYLNEPRQTWFRAFPESDIWTEKARSRHGKLELTADDTNESKSRKLQRLFFVETLKSNAPVLVEKLPINNFRLELIRAIFPDAVFVHIFRNGLEVATSIGNIAKKGVWWGNAGYKWDLIVDHANRIDDLGVDMDEIGKSHYLKGLIEWRLSEEAAVRFLGKLPDESYIEISYRAFMNSPVETVERLLSFIGVESNVVVADYVRKSVGRRSKILGAASLTEEEAAVGGRLLPLSMDPDCGGLVG